MMQSLIDCLMKGVQLTSVFDLTQFNEGYLLLVEFSSVTLFGRTIALRDDAVTD